MEYFSLPNLNSTKIECPKESHKTNKRRRAKTTSSKEPTKTMKPQTLSQNPGSSRSAIEKNRRQQMKELCATLDYLLPPRPTTSKPQVISAMRNFAPSQPKEKPPVPITLERSEHYIKNLKERVDQLKMRRDELKEDLVVADVQVYERDSVLEVTLVTGLNKGFILHRILKILQEEGAKIVSANHTRLRDKIVYTVISQAFSARIGIATPRVHERLKILSGMSTFALSAGNS